jgi:hypothetical protein
MTHPLTRFAVLIGLLAMLVPSIALAQEEIAYLVTDPAGDANGLNGQGLLVNGGPVGSTSTPVQLAQYDLLGVRYVTLFDEKVNEDGTITRTAIGLESRLGLGAEPTATGAPAIIRLTHDVNGCPIFMQYSAGTNGTTMHGTGDVRITCEGDLTGGNPPNIRPGNALKVGFDKATNELVWTYTFGTGAAADKYFTPTASIVPTVPHVRVNTGAVTAPVIDEMYNPLGRSFRVGSDAPKS